MSKRFGKMFLLRYHDTSKYSDTVKFWYQDDASVRACVCVYVEIQWASGQCILSQVVS